MFVLGLALSFGMAVEIVPGISDSWPIWIAQLFKSPIAMASITAILLTLLFRIGIASHQVIELDLSEYPEHLASFMEENGEAWGARRERTWRSISVVWIFNPQIRAQDPNGRKRRGIPRVVLFRTLIIISCPP